MRYLVDTHLLIWAGEFPQLLGSRAKALLSDSSNTFCFSTVSIWEASIKFTLGKKDFTTHPATFRRTLLDSGYQELTIASEHAIEVANLPAYHEDPFDRLLLAQAHVEGMVLLTSDKVLARYPGTLRV